MLRYGSANALRCACAKGDLQQVEELMSTDRNLSLTDKNDGLKIAVENGQAEVVEFLISAGVVCALNVNSMLYSAVLKGYVSTMRPLVAAGGSVNLSTSLMRLTPLMAAAKRGYDDVVDYLLSQQVDINAQDSYGTTALIYACENDHINVVDRLLAAGCDVNVVHYLTMRTALFEAVSRLNIGIINRLLAHGADYNLRTHFGRTVLMSAVESNSLEVTEHLISVGCDVNATCDMGLTALDFARQHSFPAIEKLLLDNGATEPVQN